MTQSQQLKLAKHIMRLVKVQEIQFPIGRTTKGNLAIRFTTNSDQYDILLDSVVLPTTSILEDDNNIELKKVLDKYLFEEDTVQITMPAPVKEKITTNSTKRR